MERDVNFVDAQEMHKQYPDTFEVPSKEDLEQLIVGDIVKVSAYNERFWAQITDIDKSRITATVNNYLLTPRLKYGDIITFGLENVHGIYPRPDELKKARIELAKVRKLRKRKPKF